MKSNMGIYQIVNKVDNKIYVGSSTNLKQRKSVHIGSLKKGKHYNKGLQIAFTKYGEDSFDFEILEYVPDRDKLFEREQYWIDELHACDETVGYNILPTAEYQGWNNLSKQVMKKLNVKNVDWMSEYLSSKYRSLEYDSTKDIIETFMRLCKSEMLNGDAVRVSKIGTFTVKTKAEKQGKDFRGKKRIIPRMVVPTFKTSSTFRDYINGDD